MGVLGLILLWAAMPALACLPQAAMTKAEMACCQKMAGNCQMGAAQHPCCKNAPKHIIQAVQVSSDLSFQLDNQYKSVSTAPDVVLIPAGIVSHGPGGLPPPSLPSRPLILRV